MCLDVMHWNDWRLVTNRQPFGHVRANEQRSCKPWSVRNGYRINLFHRARGLGERGTHDRTNSVHMFTRSELRYDTTVEVMNVALCAIGDEVRIGQVINTNASWIAAACTSCGCNVREHVTIADEATHIGATLDRLRLSSDVIIVTGGLGPTHDDITKDVLASYTGDALVESVEWLTYLESWMRQRGRELTERTRRQALMPSRAITTPWKF